MNASEALTLFPKYAPAASTRLRDDLGKHRAPRPWGAGCWESAAFLGEGRGALRFARVADFRGREAHACYPIEGLLRPPQPMQLAEIPASTPCFLPGAPESSEISPHSGAILRRRKIFSEKIWRERFRWYDAV